MRTIRFSVPKQPKSSEVISEEIFTFLMGLKNIDAEVFTEWFQQGRSKKEALSKKVCIDKTYIQEVVNKHWDNKFPELGTHFSFWTGKDDDLFNSLISFLLGMTTKNKNLSNIVTLKIPKQENAPSIDGEKIQAIVSLMKKIWGNQRFEIEE